MQKSLRACRNCKYLTEESICPNCNSKNLSNSWKGAVIIIDTNSEIARELKIEKAGIYAIYVE